MRIDILEKGLTFGIIYFFLTGNLKKNEAEK